MAQISDDLINKIKLSFLELEKKNINISQVILFGSYAARKEQKWSDIDLAVVSDDFTGNRMADYDRSIEAIPFTTKNFTPDNPFVKEILSTGVRII